MHKVIYLKTSAVKERVLNQIGNHLPLEYLATAMTEAISQKLSL